MVSKHKKSMNFIKSPIYDVSKQVLSLALFKVTTPQQWLNRRTLRISCKYFSHHQWKTLHSASFHSTVRKWGRFKLCEANVLSLSITDLILLVLLLLRLLEHIEWTGDVWSFNDVDPEPVSIRSLYTVVHLEQNNKCHSQ